MQRNFLVPVLLVGALLGACVQSEPSTPTVGVLDTARVFRDSALGKAGVKYLQDVQTELQAELDAAQKQLQEKPNDEALQAKVQEIFMNAQQRHNAENQQVITLVNDALLRTVNAYRVQKKLLGDAELLVPPTGRDLAEGALRVLGDPALYAAMSAAGRQRMGSPGALDNVVDYAAAELGWAAREDAYRRLSGA